MNIRIRARSDAGFSGDRDVLRVVEDDSFACVCVSSGRMAQINADIAEFSARMRMVWSMTEKRFKMFLGGEYGKRLGETADLRVSAAFVLINKITGVFIAFSAGGCGILAFDPELHVRTLLPARESAEMPENGAFHKGILTAGGVKGFVLLSEGAAALDSADRRDVFRLVCASAISREESEKCFDSLMSALRPAVDGDISAAVAADFSPDMARLAAEYYGCGISIAEDVFEARDEQDAQDAFSTTFADEVELSQPDAFSTTFADAVELDKPDAFSTTFADAMELDKPDAFSTTFADAMELDKPDAADVGGLLGALAQPRSLAEIADMRFFPDNSLVPALALLMRCGLITCGQDDLFRLR